jgi:pilus assembly protein CpaF
MTALQMVASGASRDDVLVDRVRSRLVAHQSDATPARVVAALRAEGLVLGDDAVLDLVQSLRQDLVGADRLSHCSGSPASPT